MVVVTGGSRGIGLEIASKLARAKCKIALLAKTVEENPKLPGTLLTAAQRIKDLGADVIYDKCDIRFEDQIKSSVQKIISHYG